MSDYVSIKDKEPEGKEYKDVICIVLNYSIAQTYKYVIGVANEETFSLQEHIFSKQNEYRNTYLQEKIIAWKPLEKVSINQIRNFITKAEKE